MRDTKVVKTIAVIDDEGHAVTCVIRGCENLPARPAFGILCAAHIAEENAKRQAANGRRFTSIAAHRQRAAIQALQEIV